MNEFTTQQEREINTLVNMFRNMGFSQSSQISNYIWRHNLGNQFPHISGYLKMSNGADNWTFKGGIAPQFYREVCERLKLGNKGTDSFVVGFTSCAELAIA